jgi:glutathione S-transferase
MYQLFIANKNYSSWSLRPWVLMRQLEIPFEEKLVPFGGQIGRAHV